MAVACDIRQPSSRRKYEFISCRLFSEDLGGPARYAYFPKLAITYGGGRCCNEAGFCLGNPPGEPSPSATPGTLNGTYTFWNRRLLMVIYLGDEGMRNNQGGATGGVRGCEVDL